MDSIDKVQEYERRHGIDPSNYDWELITGRGRFDKIVATAKLGDSRRASAFVEKETGMVYVAGAWSKPAKTRIA